MLTILAQTGRIHQLVTDGSHRHLAGLREMSGAQPRESGSAMTTAVARGGVFASRGNYSLPAKYRDFANRSLVKPTLSRKLT
jgi:hypothetical protein